MRLRQQPEYIHGLTGVKGMLSLQQDQFIHSEGPMECLPGIVGHGLVIYLLRQAAGNTQVRPADEIDRRAARRPDKVIDGPQLLHQLPERLGIQYPQIDGMWRKAAVIVEGYLKTPVAMTDPLYPADQGLFHHFPGLKGSHGDVGFVADSGRQAVFGGELLLLIEQFIMQVSRRIDDEQVFHPPLPLSGS